MKDALYTVQIVIHVMVEAPNAAAASRFAVELAREGDFDVVREEVINTVPLPQPRETT